MKQLYVYYEKELIGILTDVGDARVNFQYTPSWINNPKHFELSVSLPLQEEVFNDKQCHAYFTNLLPEGTQRDLIAKAQKFSSLNDFKLLTVIGGDCAGAISLLPPEMTPPDKEGYYEVITAEQLPKIIKQLSTRPLLAGSDDLRLSLAGAQEKLPIFYKDNTVYLPHGNLASSHIIKPSSNERFPDLHLNELYCMQLAKAITLQVAECFLIPDAIFCCQRYDRHIEKDKVFRLHQEDFCQALNLPPRKKYQADGGPSLVDCAKLIKQYSSQPALDTSLFTQWILFNFLIGNADAHAKNISFIIDPFKRTRYLAPFYDVVSTAIYPELSSKMAMKIGREYAVEKIMQDAWEAQWEMMGFRWEWFISTAQSLTQALEYQLKHHSPRNPTEEKINQVITSRLLQIKDFLA